MQFINPKTDFAFKKIFGSEQNKDILISFLNAMLYDGADTIADLKLLAPYQAPRIQGIKDQLTTYSDDIELVFVELPKFKKKTGELRNPER